MLFYCPFSTENKIHVDYRLWGSCLQTVGQRLAYSWQNLRIARLKRREIRKNLPVKPIAITSAKCIVNGGSRWVSTSKKKEQKNVETRAAIGRGRFWDERSHTRRAGGWELFAIDRSSAIDAPLTDGTSAKIFSDKEPLMNTRMKNADITGHGIVTPCTTYVDTYK